MPHAATDAVYLVTGGVLLADFALKARRRMDDPVGWASNVVELMLGTSFVVQSPLLRGYQNAIVVNLGQLTGNGTTVLAAYALRILVLRITHGTEKAAGRRVPRVSVVVLTLGAMTALFAAAPKVPGEFTSLTLSAPVVGYYLAFLSYLGLTVADLFRLTRAYTGRVGDPWLRAGLRLVSASCATGMVYIVGRATVLVVNLDDGFWTAELVVAVVLPAVTICLAVVGLATAPVVRWLGAKVRLARHRRSLRRLRPLRRAVRRIRPDLVLPVGPDSQLRLYRCVVEIQDTRLAIDRCLDDGTRARILATAREHGATPEAVEAAVFMVGLEALREERPPNGAAVGAPPVLPEEDLIALVGRLERVSAVFRGMRAGGFSSRRRRRA